MNEPLISQESKVSTSASMLFGLPRPIIGALSGFLFFSILVLIFNIWDTESGLLKAALLVPGFLAIVFFHTIANLFDSFGGIVIFLISSFPPSVIGSLTASEKKTIRLSGIILLVLYLLVSIPLGMIARILMGIAGDL